MDYGLWIMDYGLWDLIQIQIGFMKLMTILCYLFRKTDLMQIRVTY